MKSLTDLTRDFHNTRRVFENLSKDTPRIMGNIAVKVMKSNFDKQGWDNGGGVQKWKERSPVTNAIYDAGRTRGYNKKQSAKASKGNYIYAGSVYSSKNPILKQTGNLYDGLRYIAKGNWVNIGVNLNTVPYAKLMNEGGSKNFGGRWVRIPKRQFLGWSLKLDKEIKDELKRRRGLAFKPFKK